MYSRGENKNNNKEAIPTFDAKFKEYFVSKNDNNLYFINEKLELRVCDNTKSERDLTYTELIGLVKMLEADENSKSMNMLKLAKQQCGDITKKLVVYRRLVKGEIEPSALSIFILDDGERRAMDLQISLNRDNPEEFFGVCNLNGEVERKITHAEILGLEVIAKATIRKIEYEDKYRTHQARKQALKTFMDISKAYDNHVKNKVN